jgi:hypothetical protein
VRRLDRTIGPCPTPRVIVTRPHKQSIQVLLFSTVVALTQAAEAQEPAVHNGRMNEITVEPPRIEAQIEIDGVLDEAPWNQASLLTGFSQYMPVDGVAAADSTEILVWYTPTGIYFGIRAFEPHVTPNATLADRDNIDADDHVQILLDTFNDRRRALVFGINPLGVQADGIRSEGNEGGAGGRSAGGRFENVDMNPDFVFESKGRVTPWGYEIEVLIPFKSIRFQAGGSQTWAINVIRKVQHSGYENTWTPALRANASFLAQSGTLDNMHGLTRGLVLEFNPFATARVDGTPAETGWEYDATPEAGFNAQWGVTTNLTLDATVNPDFSQVEADVGVITVNERFAVFFPEKRPFFLGGIEQFATPNQLIYTRRIVRPVAGAKLNGKVGSMNIGLLSAVDDKLYSRTGDDYPFFNLLRMRRDFGENSTLGMSYTDKVEGSNYNRVPSVDARLVFAKLYYVQAQAAMSFTRADGTTKSGPMWELTADRTGRYWGFHYTFKGVDPDFETQSGFVPRAGIVQPFLVNRFSAYGKPGAFLENYNVFIPAEGIWAYDEFFKFKAPLETAIRANNRFTLRGGWSPSITPTWLTSAFDPDFYQNYFMETETGGVVDTVPLVVPDRVNDAVNIGVGIATPQFQQFSADINATFGKHIAYFEPSRANLVGLSATVNWRPTEQLRIEGRYAHERLVRERDGSRLSTANIPRLKLEYQISRPIFVRFVGQYTSQNVDELRDPGTDDPILFYDSDSDTYFPSGPSVVNSFRMDLLFSFRPTPGTVVFAGYGTTLLDNDAFKFNRLERVVDGFFVKLSYVFRS